MILTSFGNALSPYANGALVGSMFGGTLAEIRVVAIFRSVDTIFQDHKQSENKIVFYSAEKFTHTKTNTLLVLESKTFEVSTCELFVLI